MQTPSREMQEHRYRVHDTPVEVNKIRMHRGSDRRGDLPSRQDTAVREERGVERPIPKILEVMGAFSVARGSFVV